MTSTRTTENLSNIICREAVAVTYTSGAFSQDRPFYLWVGTAGNIKVDLINATGVTFKNVPAGWFRVWAKKIYQSGTVAQELLACRG